MLKLQLEYLWIQQYRGGLHYLLVYCRKYLNSICYWKNFMLNISNILSIKDCWEGIFGNNQGGILGNFWEERSRDEERRRRTKRAETQARWSGVAASSPCGVWGGATEANIGPFGSKMLTSGKIFTSTFRHRHRLKGKLPVRSRNNVISKKFIHLVRIHRSIITTK